MGFLPGAGAAGQPASIVCARLGIRAISFRIPMGEKRMANVTELGDINQQIAAIRENLRALTEQAAARSGAADEELSADRIANQEERLASLIKLRDSLSGAKS